MSEPSLSDSRRREIERIIEDHARTGDPHTGDGAEWLVVYLRRRGVTDAEQEAFIR